MSAIVWLLLFVSVSHVLPPCIDAEQSVMVWREKRSATEVEKESVLLTKRLTDREQFDTTHEKEWDGQARQLSQTDDSVEETNRGGVDECSLSRNRVRRYLDAETRTWRVDDDVLEAIDSDLQVIVNCTAEGDTLLFDVSGAVRPSARVIIPWSLTISSATEETQRGDGLYPQSRTKIPFTCPRKGEGVFLVRSKSVLLANLVFENCTFDSTTENGAIVQVEGCPLSTPSEETVRLHHVIFERNVLVSGAGLRMNTPSCAMLELKDFTFKNNTCSGRCGVILTSQNRLHDVRVQHLRAASLRNVNSTVFYAPPESTCRIKRMSAAENGCSILHVDGGALNVSDSTFTRNEIVGRSGSDDASCIHLMNATVLLEDSQFLKNRAERGCAITAQRSNLTISNCAFEENKAKKAGVIHLTASTASIQSCNFSSNQARRSAGVLMVLESQIGIVDSSFEANVAGYDGGCFHLRSASKVELFRSTLFGNGARNGGVAFLDERSVGNVLDSSFINNSASSKGGSFCITDSRLSIQRCRFENGTAEVGAGIFANSSRLLVRDTSVSYMDSFKSGGFIAMTASWTRVRDVMLTGNHASNAGGGIAAMNGSHVEAKSLTSFRDKAKSGGVISLKSDSSGFLIRCRFERTNAVRHGGAIDVIRSTLEVDHSHFSKSRANWGGILFAQDSEVNITNSSFEKGSGSYGGCMRLVGRSQGEVRDTLFTACHGRRVGGAVQLGRRSFSDFVDTTFKKNSAVFSGGTFHIEKAVANLIRCHFADGRADDGQRYDYGYGGFVLACCGSSVTVKNSTMEEGSATADGGCLSVGDSTLSVDGLTMKRCNALKDGGGMEVTDFSDADLRNIDIRSSRAKYGAVINVEESNITGRGWIVRDNDAVKSGGLYISLSKVFLENAFMKNNSARFGGAMFMTKNSTSTFVNVTFKENSAVVNGGSLSVRDSELSIQKCRFTGGSARYGGGIYVLSSTVSVIKTTASKNNANDRGGYFYGQTSEVFMSDCLYINNVAAAGGGVIECRPNCTFSDIRSNYSRNAADFGGAINLKRNSTGRISDCRFEENHAFTSGGGVYLEDSAVFSVQKCRFTKGSAKYGGGIFAQFSKISIMKTVASQNNAGDDGGYISGVTTEFRLSDGLYINNVAGRGGVIECCPNCTFSDIRSNYSHNTAGYGGAINLKRNSTGSISDCRFEKNHAFTSGGGVYLEDSAVFSVQKCRFTKGSAKYGGGIHAYASNVSVIETTASKNNASDDGGYISGQSSEVLMSDCFYIKNVAALGGGVIDCRSSCTFSDIGSNYSHNTAGYGGAINLKRNSTGSISDCRFEENHAFTSGGGVYLEDSPVFSVQKCRFTKGSAKYGGGIFVFSSRLRVKDTSATHLNASNGGGFIRAERSKVRLWRNSIVNNNASDDGGGIAGLNGSSIVDTSSVYSQDVADNGAAIYLEVNSSGTFTDCQFSTNAASKSGSAIYAEKESSVRLRHCLFSNSSATWGGFVYARISSRVNVTDTEFRNGSASYGGCLYAEHSFLSVQRTVIQECNALKNGGAMNLVWSIVRLKTVDVFRNTATSGGGGLHAENTEIAGRRCSFKNNHAVEYGGSFNVLQSSTIQGEELILDSNIARRGGGGYLKNSNLIVQDSTIQNNVATYGGAMNFPDNTTGVFLNTTFTNNSAVRSGGSVYVEQSNASFHECILQRGAADSGGLLLQWNASYVNISHSTLKDSNATWGGCLYNRGGHLTIRNATMQGCRASGAGGAMYVSGSSMSIIAYSRFVSNHASHGAFLYVNTGAVTGDMLIMRKNEASEGGGAIYSRNNTLYLSNSLFEENSARLGGATDQQMNATSVFSNVTFSDNWAIKSGGSLFSEKSVLILSRCLLRNSSAENGGLLFSWKDVLVNITESDLVQGSAHGGGCVSATKTNLTFWRTSFQNCSASEDNGGGLYIKEESSLQFTDSSIEGNRAVGNGGGLSCTSDSVVHLEDSTVKNNSAQSGGAMDIGLNATGSLINVTFVDNSADIGGNGRLRSSRLRIARSHFFGGDAEKGGGFFVSESSLNITDSEFGTMKASLQGGFIFSEKESSVVIENSSMTSGTSAVAGAVALIESDFKARHLRISHCEADGDGGAIWGVNSSRFLCIDCVLRDNSARRGGSVYLEYADAQSVAVQLVGSTVQNSSATFGGGVQVISEDGSPPSDCPVGNESCGVLALEDTSFSDNIASGAGGAIFVDRVAIIRILCSPKRTRQEMNFYSKKQWKLMNIVRSNQDICPTWRENSADRYGADIASYATDVQKKIISEQSATVVSVKRNNYEIRDHKSGAPMPVFSLAVVDDLGQCPAVGLDNKEVTATMFSPDGLFDGRMSTVLKSDLANLAVTPFALPGEYTVRIEFDGGDFEPVEITVYVRGCVMGEVLSANGAFCEPCSAATFSFLPEDDSECRPCPDNGNCESKAVLPKQGYWHQIPCSEHIQRCLAPEACEYKDREQKLREKTEEVETCDFNDQYVKNYTEAQCREGHEGPLCGSCKESHGKSHSFLCEKCFTDVGNVILVCLSFLVLLGLSAITIRSNLISAVFLPQQPQAPMTSAASTSSYSVPAAKCTMELTTMERPAQEVLGNGQSQSIDPVRTPRNSELSKWKAIELFKITVNFAQVTAIAVAVDAKWTFALVVVFQTAEFISAVASETVNRSIDCLIPLGTSVQRSVISTLVDVLQPLACIFVFALFWLLVKIGRSKPWMYLLRKCVLSALVVCYISYISISKTLINILNCVEVHDSAIAGIDQTTSYWVLDTAVTCNEGSHAILTGLLAWPFLFIFTLGFPLAIAYLIIVKVTEDYKDGWIYDIAGFVYRSYSKKYIFWESVIMCRKTVLAIVVVFSYKLGANIQAVLASFVLIMALYIQMNCRPYRKEFDSLNDTESLSILISSITFVCSIFFADDRVSHGVRILLSVFLCLANVLFFFYLLTLFAVFAAEYLKTVLVREGIYHSSEDGTFRVLGAYFINYLFVDLKDAMVRWVNHGKSRRYRRSDI